MVKMPKIQDLYKEAIYSVRGSIGYRPFLDPNLFRKVHQRLSEPDKNKLERLLEKFIGIAKIVKEDKIRFKVDNIKKVGDDYPSKFGIHFVDNIKGNLSIFIPTYTHVSRIVGKYHEVYDKWNSLYVRDEIIKNRIVSEWQEQKDLPGIGGTDCNSTVITAKIWLYDPESYVDKNGITIYLPDKKSAEDSIQKFKDILKEKFVSNTESPIVFEIGRLINKGCDLLKQEEEKREECEIEREIRSLKGKEF